MEHPNTTQATVAASDFSPGKLTKSPSGIIGELSKPERVVMGLDIRSADSQGGDYGS
jgi:hypothetical protein